MKKNRLRNRLSLLAVRPLMWIHTALSFDLEQRRDWNRRVHQIKGRERRLLGSGEVLPAVRSRSRDALARNGGRRRGGLLKTAMVGGLVLAAAVMTYDTVVPTPDYSPSVTHELQLGSLNVAPVPYVQPSKEAVDRAIRGYYHHINKQYSEALAEYDSALRLHNNYPDVHWNKALIHHKLEQYSDAVQCYQQMLRINPTDTDALYNMGYALDKLERFDDALQVYDRILEVNPDDIHAPIGKGIAQYHLGDTDAAITEFVKVLYTNPKYSLYNLACMYSVKGDTVQALEFLEQALPHADQELLDWAKQDPDFDPIRDHPTFQDLIFGR